MRTRRVWLASAIMALAVSGCMAPSPQQSYVVFFQEWSSKLDEPGRAGIADAAAWAKDHSPEPVIVTGFADTQGSRQANLDLSNTRAQVVIDELVAQGVAPSRIEKRANGSTPATGDTIASRRVEIRIGGV